MQQSTATTCSSPTCGKIQSSRTPSGDDYLDTTLPIVGLALGGIDADLTITAKALFYQDVSVGDAKLRVRSSDGTGEVIATASVLGGEYEAHLSAVTGDSTPGLTLEAKATALDLDNLTPSGDRLPSVATRQGRPSNYQQPARASASCSNRWMGMCR